MAFSKYLAVKIRPVSSTAVDDDEADRCDKNWDIVQNGIKSVVDQWAMRLLIMHESMVLGDGVVDRCSMARRLVTYEMR